MNGYPTPLIGEDEQSWGIDISGTKEDSGQNHLLQTADKINYEILYYYWRQYGNNYPILYKCSETDYNEYHKKYDGKGLKKDAGGYGGFYLNYNKYFSSSNCDVPALSYCLDTYFYYYGRTIYRDMVEKLGDPSLTPEKLKEILDK